MSKAARRVPHLVDVILEVLAGGGEWGPKAIYLELRRRGVRCAYSSVRKALTRMRRRGLVARTARGLYAGVPHLRRGTGVPLCCVDGGISAAIPSGNVGVGVSITGGEGWGVQNVAFYCPRLPRCFGERVVWVCGARVLVRFGERMVYVSRREFLSYEEWLRVEGALEALLSEYGLGLGDLVLKRLEVGCDSGASRALEGLDLAYSEARDGLILKIYRKDAERVRAEMRVAGTRVREAFELLAGGGLGYVEMRRAVEGLYAEVRGLFAAVDALTRHQLELAKLLNGLCRRLDKLLEGGGGGAAWGRRGLR